MMEYNLTRFGIVQPVSLHGNVTEFFRDDGLPVVFLFDEHHGNLNNCIDKNIENAKELIARAMVNLIGVESHYGGCEWDNINQEYCQPDKGSYLPISDNNKCGSSDFADGIPKANKDIIYGVESNTFSGELIIECGGLQNQDEKNSCIANSINNKMRSKHFIKTLFEIYLNYNLTGNLILNCGRDHNTHIKDWIDSGEIDTIANCEANYVRINTIDPQN